MPTRLLQAMVGAGKTEAALSTLSQRIYDPTRPFAKIWVLLATKRQEVAFRQRLIDLQDGRSVYFNVEFFNFYQLNTRILNLTGHPPRRINEPARLALLRKVLRDMQQADELELFAPVAEMPGFLGVLADLVYEMKQNRVYPQIFSRAAEQTRTQKDREISRIYSEYQRLLIEHDLVDLEGEGWLALSEVNAYPQIVRDVDLLLVDGYDQFTPVQAAFLAELSKQVGEVIITLTKAPGDAEMERISGQRFVEARERLQAAHQASGAVLHIEELEVPQIPRHDDLLTLGRKIFSGDEPVPASGGIHLIEAAEPHQEVSAVLRDVKRRLLAGVKPDQIVIALHDWALYSTYFDLYARLYDLPLLLQRGASLEQSPVIAVLMNLLALPGSDPDAVTSFRRRQVLDVLRSPYVRVPEMDDELVALLDRVSREKQVVGGRANWLQAIKEAAEEYIDEDGEIYEPLLTVQQESDLSLAFQDFLRNIVPPPQATILQYVEWLEKLIGPEVLLDLDEEPLAEFDGWSLQIPACIRELGDDPQTEHLLNRDTQALNLFKELLRGMLEAQEFLESAIGETRGTLPWGEFYADLVTGVKNTAAKQHSPIRSGRVLVVTAAEARGLPHDYVYVLGLSEGIFPAEQSEDPLYLDSERLRLREYGVELQTVTERADDNGIFYELISLPRKHLTLSRPYVREGKPWVESHLWRMSRAVFTDLPLVRYGIGEAVAAAEVASLDEAVLAVADALSREQPSDEALHLYQWLAMDGARSELWDAIWHGREVEAGRQSAMPFDPYTGLIQHPDLLTFVRERLHDNRLWSASQLNDYGLCPYRFFARRLLKLEALEEPQEGLNALQLGLVNHKILEATYNVIRDDGLAITPDNQGLALEILDECAAEVFKEAPLHYQFRASALWKQEQDVIRRQLRALVGQDFSSDSPLNKLSKEPRVPYALEMKFGFAGEPQVRIPLMEDESIRVRGSIDRVDRAGDRLIVVDYKTGSTGISTNEMRDGRNFQMAVYLLALEEINRQQGVPHSIAGGLFWHARNQSHSGKIEVESEVRFLEAIQDAQAHLTRYLQRARAGDFTVRPSRITDGRCASYCEFSQLCRLASTNQYKVSM